jgi:peptidoglycan/xylan/chitin deacetylase (PgdA/CDA1 family)
MRNAMTIRQSRVFLAIFYTCCGAGASSCAHPASQRTSPAEPQPTAPIASTPVAPAAAVASGAIGAAGCAELRAGGVAVSLTYDDSLQSQIDNAGPDLARYRLAGTFFVEDVGNDPAPWQALRAQGHELGSHTMKHPCPRTNSWVKTGLASEDYDLPRMTTELDDSVALLRSLGQTGPLSFAYPCGVTTVGDQHESYIAAVKARFAAARGVSSTVAPRSVDLFLTPGLFTTAAGDALVGRVSTAARTGGGWVIFGFHGVGGDHLSVTREAHAELLAYLDAHRATVWTAPFGTVAACLRDR